MASTVGNIAGGLVSVVAGGEVLDGVAAALPRVAKFLTPAVKSGIIFASQTAADDLVAGKPAGDVALDTITSAAGGYFGSAVAGLISRGALKTFKALGVTPTTLQRVILAGEGGLAFGATSTALEEAKNAAMQGKNYKLDIGGAVTNLVTTTLFGALGEFKGNPKAADIQERLNSTDPIAAARAQNDAAIFLNASEPSEIIKTDTSSTANLASPKNQQGTTSQPGNVSNDTKETARAYIEQWPGVTDHDKPAGIEPNLANADSKGYNGNWDKIYTDAVKGAGETTLADWADNTIELAQTSPVKIPENAAIKSSSKAAGYDQISYKWTDSGYNYEARWHTKTPGAPAGQGNTWVVSRVTQGNPAGQRRVIHIMVGSTWVTRYEWQAVITAYQNGTMTAAQEAMLKAGHWFAP